jgi:hypothetical protein
MFMKKVYSLLFAFIFVASVNAQTEKSKVYHQPKNQESHSGGSSVNHHSNTSKNNHSDYSSRSTTAGTHRESNATYKSSNYSGLDRAEKLEAKQKPTEAKVTSEEKETNEVKGGIRKVDEKPEIYQEPKKDIVPVAGTGLQPGDVNVSGENTEEKQMKKGLSQTTTTYRNNGIRINRVIVTCDEMMNAGRNRRWEILSVYEFYDLSQIKRCMTEFPTDDRWEVTCDEFEKSDEARKKHILDYDEFYNIDNLKNCDSYKKFKENLSDDTEE